MPGHIMKFQEQVGVTLKFIIVGGGISGIATAYTLRKAGHEVLLLEKSDGKARSTGGLRSPPNMTKLLNQWGLGPTLDHIAQQCQRINFYSGDSGDNLGSMVMNGEFIRDLVAGFLFVQHGELQSLLHGLAKEEGVSFRYNSKVLGADSESGSVLLHTGERLYADIIIGADGYDSAVRSAVVNNVDVPPQEKHLILTFIIPSDKLTADEDLRPLTNPSVWSFWLGDEYVVHANVLNAGRDYTVTIAHNYEGPIREGDDDWKQNCEINQYGIDFSKLEARAKKLLDLGTNISSRIFCTRSYLENLVSDSSRVILVGEAAHPLLPGGHHCTALALEDAQTLGCLFARIQHKNQVSRLHYDYHHQALLKAPQGAVQQMRDARLRKTLIHEEGEHLNEETFMEVWGNEFVLFAHDATEKVEDWWGQYGSLIVHDPHWHSIVPNLEISISKDTSNLAA